MANQRQGHCWSCHYYDGSSYGGNMLICGMHPTGPLVEGECSDWEAAGEGRPNVELHVFNIKDARESEAAPAVEPPAAAGDRSLSQVAEAARAAAELEATVTLVQAWLTLALGIAAVIVCSVLIGMAMPPEQSVQVPPAPPPPKGANLV